MVLTPDQKSGPSSGPSPSPRNIAFHDEMIKPGGNDQEENDVAGPFSSKSRNISFASTINPQPPERWTAALEERLSVVKAKMWEAQKSWSAEQEIYVKEVCCIYLINKLGIADLNALA
jgi:hypothetical protein